MFFSVSSVREECISFLFNVTVASSLHVIVDLYDLNIICVHGFGLAQIS